MRSAVALIIAGLTWAYASLALGDDDEGPLTASWIAIELNGKPVEGLTLDYTTDKVSGTGGCNHFSGPITVEDDAVQIGPLVSTRMMCEGRGETESEYFSALEAARSFVLDGDMLVLKAEDGRVLVKFRK